MGISMKHSKRHGEILRLLQEEGTITIARLADRLGVQGGVGGLGCGWRRGHRM